MEKAHPKHTCIIQRGCNLMSDRIELFGRPSAMREREREREAHNAVEKYSHVFHVVHVVMVRHQALLALLCLHLTDRHRLHYSCSLHIPPLTPF